MNKKISIPDNGKVNIKWSVKSSDYSKEEEDKIKNKFSVKYGIKSSNITIEPNIIGENGLSEIEYTSEVAENIQTPEFQHKLFKKYLDINEIENYDFEEIISIDNLINQSLDYEVYDYHKRYKIKWIRWSNFMSYGPDNYFDFTNLKGLVLLSSEPANQGGKTTFCLDLLRFLLYGKVTSREDDWSLSKVFNKHLPESNEVTVEGCINIDGEDYVIKRIVSRPSYKNRKNDKYKSTQKINYYKIVDSKYIDLQDENENHEESTVRETNAKIKEAIGNEKDFDLMICVDSDNLKGLISLKDTERGRLISRWIGLLPLEDKDKLARETFNKSIYPKMSISKYSKENIEKEIDQINNDINDVSNEINKIALLKEKSEKLLNEYSNRRDELLSSIIKIDEALSKYDVSTLDNKLKEIVENGKRKRIELKSNIERYESIKSVSFNKDEYKSLSNEYEKVTNEKSDAEAEYKNLAYKIDTLKKGEFCPTCGSKLKNIDNSKAIKESQEKLELIIKKGKELSLSKDKIKSLLKEMESNRELYDEKTKLELLIEKNNVDIENLTSKYKEIKRILNDIENNKESIKRNNEITLSLNNLKITYDEEKKYLDSINSSIAKFNTEIEIKRKKISELNDLNEILKKEEKTLYSWKLYLDMVGKNGISKMVVKNVLPIINGELKRILTDVCDFSVEVSMNEKNEIYFSMIHDGVKSNLSSGSGFEKTVASLALRSVLGKISTFSKPSFVVFDEVLGGVSDENYDKVKLLYDKIVTNYDFIFQITHLKQIADWHKTIVTVIKENDISRIINN